VGPIAFVIVFMLVPLAAALFAGAFFAAIGIIRVLEAVPTGAWAVLAVAAALLLASRLWVVVRELRSDPG
jgi:di/tricarboxylate transporter